MGLGADCVDNGGRTGLGMTTGAGGGALGTAGVWQNAGDAVSATINPSPTMLKERQTIMHTPLNEEYSRCVPSWKDDGPDEKRS